MARPEGVGVCEVHGLEMGHLCLHWWHITCLVGTYDARHIHHNTPHHTTNTTPQTPPTLLAKTEMILEIPKSGRHPSAPKWGTGLRDPSPVRASNPMTVS